MIHTDDPQSTCLMIATHLVREAVGCGPKSLKDAAIHADHIGRCAGRMASYMIWEQIDGEAEGEEEDDAEEM